MGTMSAFGGKAEPHPAPKVMFAFDLSGHCALGPAAMEQFWRGDIVNLANAIGGAIVGLLLLVVVTFASNAT